MYLCRVPGSFDSRCLQALMSMKKTHSISVDTCNVLFCEMEEDICCEMEEDTCSQFMSAVNVLICEMEKDTFCQFIFAIAYVYSYRQEFLQRSGVQPSEKLTPLGKMGAKLRLF